MSLADIRRDYARATLEESAVAADPFAQFAQWFEDALSAQVLEANAMTLATVDADGRPSARIVLLKDLDERGFVFFTDYRSRKAGELDATRQAALTFHWPELERQVRVIGASERTSAAESLAYYRQRPRGSRIGAWASHQSSVIASREPLESRVRELDAEFGEADIPLPPHWGGFRIVPDEIEFWQGRPSRLHDRIQYTRTTDGRWLRVRLSP